MTTNDYRYALMLFTHDGTPLGQASIEVDWEPAAESVRFEGVRRGLLDPGARAETSVAPLWSEERGAPYVRGFRVALPGLGDDSGLASEFSIQYFKDLAHRASSPFIADGSLKAGETFRYVPVAFCESSAPVAQTPARFRAEAVAPAIPFRLARLAERLEKGRISGDWSRQDVPVFMPQPVLDEALLLTRAAGELESGGVLIGHLHRDAALPEMFVEITAQIPARGAKAGPKSLSFTPEVWSEIQGVLDLRREHEIMVGWWHSHPSRIWCGACKPENQRVCQFARAFLSEHDRQLHRAVFPRAYSVALLVNDGLAGVELALFGWRHGVLERRGYHVTGLPLDGAAHCARKRNRKVPDHDA